MGGAKDSLLLHCMTTLLTFAGGAALKQVLNLATEFIFAPAMLSK
jgi:hypothetical protein